jgi:hypothetical protein
MVANITPLAGFPHIANADNRADAEGGSITGTEALLLRFFVSFTNDSQTDLATLSSSPL